MVIPQFFNKVKSIYYEISKVELQVVIGKTRMKRIVIHGLILEYQSLLLLGVFKETKQRRKLNRKKNQLKKLQKNSVRFRVGSKPLKLFTGPVQFVTLTNQGIKDIFYLKPNSLIYFSLTATLTPPTSTICYLLSHNPSSLSLIFDLLIAMHHVFFPVTLFLTFIYY